MIFVPTGHECVIVLFYCFSPILLCFILSCPDISEWKAFPIKPTVCKILTFDVSMKECKPCNAKCLTLFRQILAYAHA